MPVVVVEGLDAPGPTGQGAGGLRLAPEQREGLHRHQGVAVIVDIAVQRRPVGHRLSQLGRPPREGTAQRGVRGRASPHEFCGFAQIAAKRPVARRWASGGVLERVKDDRQAPDHEFDVGMLQQFHPLPDDVGDPLVPETVPIGANHVIADAVEQQGDLPVVGDDAILLQLTEGGGDFSGLIVGTGALHDHHAGIPVPVGDTGPDVVCGAVPSFFPDDGPHPPRGRLRYSGAGPVVDRQPDGPATGNAPGERPQTVRSGSPKGVDALVVVADHHEVAAARRPAPEYLGLQRRGVLVLVHHRIRARVHYVVRLGIAQQVAGPPQEVGKVGESRFPQGRLVFQVHRAHRPVQRVGGRYQVPGVHGLFHDLIEGLGQSPDHMRGRPPTAGQERPLGRDVKQPAVQERRPAERVQRPEPRRNDALAMAPQQVLANAVNGRDLNLGPMCVRPDGQRTGSRGLSPPRGKTW